MRYFVYIFAFYIFVLALMPCHDCMIKVTENCTELTQHNNNCHSGDIDLCTPFCICNCCSFAISQIHILRAPQYFKTLLAKEHMIYLLNVTRTIPSFIWQPPKMF